LKLASPEKLLKASLNSPSDYSGSTLSLSSDENNVCRIHFDTWTQVLLYFSYLQGLSLYLQTNSIMR